MTEAQPDRSSSSYGLPGCHRRIGGCCHPIPQLPPIGDCAAEQTDEIRSAQVLYGPEIHPRGIEQPHTVLQHNIEGQTKYAFTIHRTEDWILGAAIRRNDR